MIKNFIYYTKSQDLVKARNVFVMNDDGIQFEGFDLNLLSKKDRKELCKVLAKHKVGKTMSVRTAKPKDGSPAPQKKLIKGVKAEWFKAWRKFDTSNVCGYPVKYMAECLVKTGDAKTAHSASNALYRAAGTSRTAYNRTVEKFEVDGKIYIQLGE